MKRKMSEISDNQDDRISNNDEEKKMSETIDDDDGGIPAQEKSCANSVEEEAQEGGDHATATDDSFEEECVICLEVLSSEDWGRCTPCQHAFHKKCWWEWENAHNERLYRQRQQGNRSQQNEGPKCCLCNTRNEKFVDSTGAPAHNPSPYVASEEPAGDTGGGGNRFSNFLRGIGGEEAADFIDFVQTGEIPQRNSPTRNSNNANTGRSNRSFIPPFFGSSNNSDRSSRASPNLNGSIPPFGVPPFFRNSTQRTWQTSSTPSYANSSNNANPYNLIRPGTQIITQNLVSSLTLNNRRGVVLQFQPESRRYIVQFEANVSSFITGDNVTPVAMKPENLLQTAKIRIHGLQSQPNLNGKNGTVCAYSRERNRYVVRVDSSLLSATREVSIQPTNIRIANGTVVRLEGLQRTPQWNGKYGTVARWVGDQSSGRYEVRLSRQYAVRVKMENVRL